VVVFIIGGDEYTSCTASELVKIKMILKKVIWRMRHEWYWLRIVQKE